MFDIIEFLTKIFKKEKAEESGPLARERLKLVLVTDRASITPNLLESLKEELIELISRYMTIDTEAMEIGFERKQGSVALAANIPIIQMKRNPVKPEKHKKLEKAESPVPAVEEKLELSVKKQEEMSQVKVSTASRKEELPEKTQSAKRKKAKHTSKRFQARAQGKSLRKRTAV